MKISRTKNGRVMKKIKSVASLFLVFILQLSRHATAMAQRPVDPNAPPPPAWVNIVPIAVMFGVFYFLLIRPQLRQKKEKDNLVSALKKGDRVITQGGLIVTIVN